MVGSESRTRPQRRRYWLLSLFNAYLVAGISILLAFNHIISNHIAGICINDPLIDFSGSIKIDPCVVFSEGYDEARDKFRSYAERAGANLHALPVYKWYTIDVAVLKGDMPGVVLHTSGMHGVEGYAGSAIQLAYLQYMALTNEKRQPRPTIILIHAVNPWGMAHFRRSNEENVDLNRNALFPHEWKAALQRDPNIANYQDFDSLLNPPQAPTAFDNVRFVVHAVITISKNGLLAMKRSIVTGQYHKPAGIFFGGQELQKSHKLLKHFIVETLPAFRVGNNISSIVTWIDVHTGLGKSGVDSLILVPGISTDDLERTFSGALINDPGASSGYEMADGLMQSFYREFFSVNSNAWIITQEFGTYPNIIIARALILENMARHYMSQEEAQPWVLLTRSAFYPRTTAWRKAILVRGLMVLSQAISRSSTAGL